ncbi:MAG: hypothetical protein Kow0029_03330 [Candidatus Rifleibacteriota bacterium]
MKNHDARINPSSKREKATIVFMLAAIFMSFMSGLDNWFENRIKKATEAAHNKCNAYLKEVATRTDKAIFPQRKILPLLVMISKKLKTPEAIRREFLNRYNLDLNIYYFSEDGKLKHTSPQKAPHLWLMKNLYPALREKNFAKLAALAKKLDKKIQFAFGYGKDLVSIKNCKERIIETIFEDKPGVLCWTSRKNNGVIIYCQELPKQNSIFRGEMLSDKKPANLISIGLVNEGSNPKTASLPERAYRAIIKTAQDSGNYGGKNWYFLKTFTGKVFFACFKPAQITEERLQKFARLFLVIAAGIALYFFTFSGAPLSLKTLLISMFFASSLIPLGGIIVTTIDNLKVFQEIEANKIKAYQEETLGNIGQSFSAYLASCSATLQKLTENPGDGGSSPKTLEMKQNILKVFPDAEITLRNSGGEIIFYHGSLVSQGRETVFKSLARKMVERYIPERLNEHKYNGNQFSDSMVNKDDMGFGTILNFPNTLQFVNTGNAELLLYYRAMPAGKGPCAIVQIELSTYNTIKKYLESLRNKRFAIENNQLKISAFYPKGYRWSLPPEKKHEMALLKIAENTWSTGRSQFEKLSASLHGFALCLKHPNLYGNYLLAFCSNEYISESLHKMKLRIALGLALALILLVSIALWISRQLISPLDQLEVGVNALATRKFETRLPEPPGKDELAKLFIAFNEMMAESYDLQIAKNVQEGLIPQVFPEIEGFSVHGILREASELGGDCLDCFMVDEKRMLFLVGDITGHGVGSALIMAFSRAVTFHWSQSQNNSSPTFLADQLDSMLRRNKTKRMFMGIICGILDTENNTIELVVKGHIYPLLIRSDKKTEWVGLPAYPLGIGKASPARSISFELNPAERLLCITDGILECHSRGQPIGFEGIEKWAVESDLHDAKDWIEDIQNKFSIWSKGEQHDDISIFAICNNSEKKNS